MCRAMAPQLAQFERDYGKQIPILEIDVDNREAADFQHYLHDASSDSIPETIIVKDGKAVFNRVGYMSYEELKAAVMPYLSGNRSRSPRHHLERRR
ncbi:MAG: thioredoxin family protein [Candidatus Xenobia bacterium]